MKGLLQTVRQPFVALQGPPGGLEPLAVDLGYSARARSCGIAWGKGAAAEQLTFGSAVRKVAALLDSPNKKHRGRPPGQPRFVLVLEAVLSTWHDPATGNPDLRGEFERGRGWYYGPGAVTLIAAQRFLEQLALLLPPEAQVPLAEALLSFKRGPVKHSIDARTICRQFESVVPDPARDGCEPISPLIRGVPWIWKFEAQG